MRAATASSACLAGSFASATTPAWSSPPSRARPPARPEALRERVRADGLAIDVHTARTGTGERIELWPAVDALEQAIERPKAKLAGD